MHRIFELDPYPVVIVSLDNRDVVFGHRIKRILNLQVVDAYTYNLHASIVTTILDQIIDRYTGNFSRFLNMAVSLPDYRDFDRVEYLDYLPGLRSPEFQEACKAFALEVGFMLQARLPCRMEDYDIFIKKHMEGAVALGVFKKNLMK